MVRQSKTSASPKTSSRESFTRRLLKVIVSMLFGLILLALIVPDYGDLVFAPFFSIIRDIARSTRFLYPVLVVVVLLIAGHAQLSKRSNRRQAAIVLAYVEQAIRLNLPLPAMLQAAGRSETPEIAKQLSKLDRCLESGTSLAGALETAVPNLPPRQTAMIHVAERTGRLAGTLSRLVRRAGDLSKFHAGTVQFYRVYPLLVLGMVAMVVSLMMILIIPKYEQILLDFNVEMPPVTRAMIGISRSIAFPLAILAQIVMVFVVLRTASTFFRPLRRGFQFAKKAIDEVLWRLPLIHGLERDSGLADACRMLADTTAAGMPPERALDETAELRINHVLQKRLRAWSSSIASGMSVKDAARNAHLPNLIIGLIGSDITSRNAPAMFEFLSRYYETRFSRTRILLHGALFPAMVLLMSFLVGFIALAMFAPMVTLSNQVQITTGYW